MSENWEIVVKKPSHYVEHYPVEVKQIIQTVLNTHGQELSPYQCYCFGAELKYRLRAGFKDDIIQEIKKAMEYKEFREEDK